MSDTTITVRSEAAIGRISPRLYGHFAEHLGRCCYDGLWVGLDRADIAHDQGFRHDVLAALGALPVPLLRWPGGCYADHYHWRDGVGPTGERPRRLGMSCNLQVEDDNGLGTHEFLYLCRQLGAEPYLAGNMGTGSPQELCDWLEYCNSMLDTTLTRQRAANGHAEPFNVPLWGVGNENWGCGGNYDAATYAREYRRYATMLRHVAPRAELVACGYEDDWNRELLDVLGPHLHLVDHLSIHRYWINGGPETDFSDDDYYALLAEAEETEDFIKRTAAFIREATPRSRPESEESESGESEQSEGAHAAGRRRIGIALDEWGVWHPEVRSWGVDRDAARWRDPATGGYEQAGTLRDALAAAIVLEGFHRQCNVLTLANLAQIVNVLHAPVMTEGAGMWLTPTYHALRLHAPHIGATALPVKTDGADTIPGGSNAVSATASRRTGGVTITLINRHLNQPASVRIFCPGARGGAEGQVLTADRPCAVNSAAEPDRVAPAPLTVVADGPDAWRVELPPHSLATILV